MKAFSTVIGSVFSVNSLTSEALTRRVTPRVRRGIAEAAQGIKAPMMVRGVRKDRANHIAKPATMKAAAVDT